MVGIQLQAGARNLKAIQKINMEMFQLYPAIETSAQRIDHASAKGRLCSTKRHLHCDKPGYHKNEKNTANP